MSPFSISIFQAIEEYAIPGLVFLNISQHVALERRVYLKLMEILVIYYNLSLALTVKLIFLFEQGNSTLPLFNETGAWKTTATGNKNISMVEVSAGKL